MTAGLGIAVGTANSRFAVCAGTGPVPGGTPIGAYTHRSPVLVRPDGSVTFPLNGADAVDASGGELLGGFVERVGDPVGVLDGHGRVHRAEDLVAAVVSALSAAAGSRDSADTAGPTVVAHPVTWSTYAVATLGDALARAGLSAVSLVPDAVACVRWLESVRGTLDDGVVVVYDLGASGLDVTVVRTGSEPEILGRPVRTEDVSGAQFDHLVTRYVLDTLAGKVPDLDPFDAATVPALTELRRHCAAAKEALSADTEAVLPVALPGFVSDVRLVRSEVEDLIRTPLTTSLEAIREALRAAEVEVSDVETVLLTGGGGTIPLLTELISSELGLTVAAAPDPAATAALGAAALGAALETVAPSTAAPSTAAARATPDTVSASIPAPEDQASVRAPRPVTAPRRFSRFPARVQAPQGWSLRRRVTVVASSVAAIGVLTAGGLAIGTGGLPAPTLPTGGDHPSTPGAATVAEADPGSTPSTTGAPAGSIGSAVVRTVAGIPTAAAVRTAPGPTAGPGSTTAPTSAEAAAPAPETRAAAPGPWPGLAPPPAPDLGQIGTGISDAANGFGRNVADGIGAGVGGMVDGINGAVGAVVDPLTGLRIGN